MRILEYKMCVGFILVLDKLFTVSLIRTVPSQANCLEIWDPQSPGTLRACTGIALLYLYIYSLAYF